MSLEHLPEQGIVRHLLTKGLELSQQHHGPPAATWILEDCGRSRWVQVFTERCGVFVHTYTPPCSFHPPSGIVFLSNRWEAVRFATTCCYDTYRYTQTGSRDFSLLLSFSYCSKRNHWIFCSKGRQGLQRHRCLMPNIAKHFTEFLWN